MIFEKAAIKIEKAQEYAKLQGVIEQAFSPDKVEQFLKQLDRKGIRIRNVDAVLAEKVLERFGEPGLNAQQLYQALPLSGRRRCASCTCRSWKVSTPRCVTNSRSCTSITSRTP